MVPWHFRHWPILWKILSISIISLVVFSLTSLFFFIPYIEQRLVEAKKQGTRSVVEVAYQTLVDLEDEVRNGSLTRAAAEALAKERIGRLRYHNDQYLWINDLDMRMLMHPIRPEFNGRDLSDFKDASGHFFFRDFIKVAQQKGAGFVRYLWPKPGGQVAVAKVSYVKLFQPWGWVLGSGIYLDDIERDLARLRHDLLWGMLLFTALTLALAYFIGASITRPLRRVMHGLDYISRGRTAELEPQLLPSTRDEIGRLGQRFNQLMEAVNHLARFKKVLEDEDSLALVYRRVGELLIGYFGFPAAFIFEALDEEGRMRQVWPAADVETDLLCDAAILAQSRLCKAQRTGHPLANLDFPEVCHRYAGAELGGHYCLPLLVGGRVIGVVQVAFALPGTDPARTELESRLAQAEQYLRESLAVIESKQLMVTLRETALLDPLTGLHNRRYLQEYTEDMVAGLLRRGKQAGLLMCDIDYFKQVNDQHGHHFGDLVLKETAAVIRQAVRSADIVIRFGGEEFLVVLLDIEAGETASIGEKIRQQVEESSFIVDKEVLHKTISIGAAEYPADAESLWNAIKFADVALYRAKQGGRNRVVRFLAEMWDGEEF